MAFIEINGAQIYYETFGEERAGQAPVLLIHGSTNTGQEDWRLVAPLLARNWRVIVPDCRGHGQSSNPNHSYSFKELAADMAALIRALGYPRAHVIGHSNGGNVALVVLMEHPEVVQTAIPQAANAYVSHDLIEKEPAIFDPERVAREAPGWMNQMIALHGATHGQEYWRDLLQMTVAEIIREPNYTPDDLRRVKRPVLVIQGEKDRVNAPQRHAQFIARHIPYAELWIPAGIGHNVHDEILFDWVQCAEDFLRRRGDEVNESLYRLGKERYADNREAIFDVRAVLSLPGPSGVELQGQVLHPEQRQAAIECAVGAAPQAEISSQGVTVLLDDDAPWALINRNVTDLRREPRTLSERVSQGLMGEAVRVLRETGDWAWVRMEHDGYVGWLHRAALHPCSRQEVEAYQSACRSRVIAEMLPALTQHPAGRPATADVAADLAGKLPFSLAVCVDAEEDGYARVRLPDGRAWWVESAGLLPVDQCPQPDVAGIAGTLKLMQRFIGVPYLWGGRTPFGYDCSGLAGAFYYFMGVRIPRDADQQCSAGIPVEGEPLPGDLLFFGESVDDVQSARIAAVTHVGISLGGGEIIHANGAAWGVSYNSLDPQSPIYRAWLSDNLVGVRRFV